MEKLQEKTDYEADYEEDSSEDEMPTIIVPTTPLHRQVQQSEASSRFISIEALKKNNKRNRDDDNSSLFTTKTTAVVPPTVKKPKLEYKFNFQQQVSIGLPHEPPYEPPHEPLQEPPPYEPAQERAHEPAHKPAQEPRPTPKHHNINAATSSIATTKVPQKKEVVLPPLIITHPTFETNDKAQPTTENLMPLEPEFLPPDGNIYSCIDAPTQGCELIRQLLSNRSCGVTYFDTLMKKYEGLRGLSHHVVKADDAVFPCLRPRLHYEDEAVLGRNTSKLVMGVSDVVHVCVNRHTAPKLYVDELWLVGVLKNGVSVSLRLTGFLPSFLVRRADVGVDLDSDEDHPTISRELNWTESDCENLQLELNAVYPPRVSKIVPENHRVQLCGFTNGRRRAMVRVFCHSTSLLKKAAKQLRECKKYRVYHDDWSFAEQYIHRSWDVSKVRSSGVLVEPGVYSAGVYFSPPPHNSILKAPERNIIQSVRIGGWCEVDRTAVNFLTPEQIEDRMPGRRSTCQVEGSVKYWDQILPCAIVDNVVPPLPLLIATFDIECINERGYRHKINKMPNANVLADRVVSIAIYFYVGTLGVSGPIVTICLALHEVLPLGRDIITYWFDTEEQLLKSFFKLTVDCCEVDGYSGYYSLRFDMPYLYERCIHYRALECHQQSSRFLQSPSVLKINGYVSSTAAAETAINDDAAEIIKKMRGNEEENANDEDDDDLDSDPKKNSTKSVCMPGRSQFDLALIVEGFISKKLTNYTLENVTESMLPTYQLGKLKLKYTQIAPNFYGSVEARTFLSLYCLRDVLLVGVIDMKYFTLSYFLDLASTTNCSIDALITGGEQIKIMGSINEMAHQQGWFVNPEAFQSDPDIYYTEPIPYDWDNNTVGAATPQHNLMYEYLSKRYAEGAIEPLFGYSLDDQSAAARKQRSHWLKQLCKNRILGEQQCEDVFKQGWAHEVRKQKMALANSMLHHWQKKTPITTAAVAIDTTAAGGDSIPEWSVRRHKSEVESLAEFKTMMMAFHNERMKKRVQAEQKWEDLSKRDCSQEAFQLRQQERKAFDHTLGKASLSQCFSDGGQVLRTLNAQYSDKKMFILDFEGLYPAIFRAMGYCFSTIITKGRKNYNRGKALYYGLPGLCYRKTAVPQNIMDKELNAPVFYFNVILDTQKPTTAQLIAYRQIHGKNSSPPSDVQRFSCLLTPLINSYVETRSAEKKLMAACNARGDKFNAAIHDCKQKGAKIKTNAVYGFTNVLNKAKLPCRPLAHMTCATGRNQILITKCIAENLCLPHLGLDQGAQVVGGDTDSIFGYFPDLDPRHEDYDNMHREACEAICSQVGEIFMTPNNLQHENTTTAALYLGQKRYAFTNLKKDTSIKGIMKRSLPPALLTVQSKATHLLLVSRVGEAWNLVMEFVTRLSSGSLPLSELSMSAAYNPATSRCSGRGVCICTDKDKASKTSKNKSCNAQGRLFHMLKQRTKVQYESGDRIQYIVVGDQVLEELEYAQTHNLKPYLPSYIKQMKAPLDVLFCNFIPKEYMEHALDSLLPPGVVSASLATTTDKQKKLQVAVQQSLQKQQQPIFRK